MRSALVKTPCVLLLATFALQINIYRPSRASPLGLARSPREYAASGSTSEASAIMNTFTPDVDYCALAAESSRLSQGFIPYQVAKGCYEMFPFDPRIRDDAIKNVRANLESFYVFYDIARSPPTMENSDLNPVNITASLIELGSMSFPNDYAFHNRLSHEIAKLQDPHTTYRSMCYQQFMFIQPISTYGVYENGRQQVKIATVLNKLDSRLTSALIDCEVTHIDGRSAFDVITDFAKTKSYSKDRGSRINRSFSFLAHDKTGSSYDRYALGSFAQRTGIPQNGTIEYRIDCQSKIDAGMAAGSNVEPRITITLAWTALDATMAPFIDAESYRRQFCEKDSVQTLKKFALDSAQPDDFNAMKAPTLSNRRKAKELYRGTYASFHLLSDSVTGVFRLGTESPSKPHGPYPDFYTNIDKGFAALEATGVTRLIVDLQSNTGGIICWGRYVLQTLFPQTVDSPYIYSMRASPLARALARATFWYDQEVNSPYEGLVDPLTGEEFTSDSWINPGSRIPGRQGAFSREVTDRYCSAVEDVKGEPGDAMFEPQDIILLTNGFCGSTCAVLALQMHERYGVRTVAIGGEHGQSMMFTSFPGGAVQGNNTAWVQRIHKVFDTLPPSAYTSELEALLPKQLPVNGQMTFTFRQVMSVLQPDRVLEYMRIPSEYRMDYTSARFRMPSILWEDVRDEVWGRATPSTSTEDEAVGEEDEDEDRIESQVSGQEAYFGIEQTGTIVTLEDMDDEPSVMEKVAPDADREDLVWQQQGYEMGM
ncbi:hypothetical protein B0O80DRAFT_526102 [Mortierella sp. GBAus27b]|nr:hypothetical protein BGX31_011551 [Mortierella sp. GBA43]KAI8359378.1 hypothetical protein B0O80DRAFT_526102 [Mortierella sp. GBAus27b]